MAYSPPTFKNQITLQLSRNETRCVIDDFGLQMANLDRELVTRYPDHRNLQAALGEWIGVEEDRIVVTAGGDDSIDRVMKLALSGDRKKIVTHAPSFEMVDIYAGNYGGELDSTNWLDGEFPLADFLKKIDNETALVVVVSPNNPTGGFIRTDQIKKIADTCREIGCRLLVDNAYIEFADEDQTSELLDDDNLLIVRTFSKAWGLAGLRVGYLIAPDAEFANQIRNASGPFPVSSVSLETALNALTNYRPQMQSSLSFIKTTRGLMNSLISACGGKPFGSQGNFVLAEFESGDNVWEGLVEDGIGVRKFPGSQLLTNRLRISCPVSPAEYLQFAKSMCRIHQLDFEPQKDAMLAALQEFNGDVSSTSGLEKGSSGSRTARASRETKETKISLQLDLDGSGNTDIDTGIGFLDHMLTALVFHSRMDLLLKCQGDLEVDDHHTAEDCALALGAAIDEALGPRTGIKRFGFAYAPLDEALARTVLDLSGRPWPEIHLKLEREMVGTWACENITHFFQSLAMSLRCSLHVDVIRGSNDHHRVEAAFKSLAKALQQAITHTTGSVPSTKGVL